MALINKMFNAKVLSGKELLSLSEGVPQGNILSPLLSNIYFSKLDEEIERLIVKYRKGEKATRNNKYYQAIQLSEKEKVGKSDRQINAIKKRKTLLARKKGLTPTTHDDNYCRVTYVRYADDFIVGIRGTKDIARKIFEEVKTFLKSNLRLTVNEEKTHITHIYSNKAHFLGMELSCAPTNQIPFRRAAHIERFRRLQLRVKRKTEIAEERYRKILQTEIIKTVRRNGNKLDKSERDTSLTELCNKLGINLAIKETNARGIYRKLATELSQVPSTKEDPEIITMLEPLKTWSKQNMSEILDKKTLEKGNQGTQPKMRPITIKEVGARIFNKFGKDLELKSPTAKGFRIPQKEVELLKNTHITKLPDDFQLSKDQLENIRKVTTGVRGQSTKRYLEVVKIINSKQED